MKKRFSRRKIIFVAAVTTIGAWGFNIFNDNRWFVSSIKSKPLRDALKILTDNQLGKIIDENKLISLSTEDLIKIMEKSLATKHPSANDHRILFQQLIEKDFAEGNTLYVQGWIYSKTEAILSLLAHRIQF